MLSWGENIVFTEDKAVVFFIDIIKTFVTKNKQPTLN